MNKEAINIEFLGQFIQEGIYILPEDRLVPASDSVEEKREDKDNKEKAVIDVEDVIPKLAQLGEFRKQVLILVNNKIDSIITEEEKDFFAKLIPAIKLTWADVAIVNIQSIANNEKDLYNYINTFDYKVLLAFTGQIASLKAIAEVELYKSIKSASKLHLLANPISELNLQKDQKVLLWKELQQIF